MVERRGFEPLASALRTQRDPNFANAPYYCLANHIISEKENSIQIVETNDHLSDMVREKWGDKSSPMIWEGFPKQKAWEIIEISGFFGAGGGTRTPGLLHVRQAL